MIPEITIKISFARESAEAAVSAAVTAAGAGGAELAPPESPAEAQAVQIPPPPTLEEALGAARGADIPPPPAIPEAGPEAGAIPPPE